MKRLVLAACLLMASGGAFAQTAPKEITLPVDVTITLQVGETRVFKFGEAINRVGLSEDNVVEATSVQDNAFAFRGLKGGKVIVTARSEDNSQTHRMRIIVGGRQVRLYNRYEPDYFSVNCDEFGCGQGQSSKVDAKSTTIRTPTGGGGFVERSY